VTADFERCSPDFCQNDRSNGQGVAQIAAGHGGICFSVAVAIWCWLGIIVGQIRTLRGLGLFANAAVWINLLIIVSLPVHILWLGIRADAALLFQILSMAFIAHRYVLKRVLHNSTLTDDRPAWIALLTTRRPKRAFAVCLEERRAGD
jgi:hypothetical protein